MGQKVNPHGLRVGFIKNWDSRWYMDKKHIADMLVEDNKVRDFLKKKLYAAGISKIEIERTVNKITVNIFTAKPGVLIGKGGQGIDIIKADVEKLVNKTAVVNVIEVKKPEMDAQLIAENIAAQLEKRISFRRAMKQALSRAMKSGAKGIKTAVSGRLGGAEIARREGYHEGSIPLQTFRADIDYGFAEAHTTYGRIGVKVWVYKGEVLSKQRKTEGVN
ncbi:MAG TPA: 30S ribosomal protein S3 [Clostridia bacterium]|nr:30S ribosomal protein S3 [Clostridia bacterium]